MREEEEVEQVAEQNKKREDKVTEEEEEEHKAQEVEEERRIRNKASGLGVDFPVNPSVYDMLFTRIQFSVTIYIRFSPHSSVGACRHHRPRVHSIWIL